MKIINKAGVTSLGIASMLVSSLSFAAVSPEDAARLNKELTPTGAERAANADGSIPEWNGGLTEAVPGYQGSGSRYVDPFADEKPLFSVTADNMAQYKDHLIPAQQEMLKKYPGYRMDIYPTHRTHALPQEIYDNTAKAAVEATMSDDGNTVVNAHAAVPFPIPKTGTEVVWNHLLRFQGKGSSYDYETYFALPSGKVSATGGGHYFDYFPYYDQSEAAKASGDYFYLFLDATIPARRKGEVLLIRDALNVVENPRRAWQYLPGMRRVRRAPTIAYDTPSSNLSGLATIDDAYVFNGAPDRYDWKLVGKKEMYIPYNAYKVEARAELEEVYTPNHINPDYVRYENHRVWVVEGTLKDGARHIYGKRTLYIDEDSWLAVHAENYDTRGNLWRLSTYFPVAAYDLPGVVGRTYMHNDLPSGRYGTQVAFTNTDSMPDYSKVKKQKFFTTESIRRQAKR